MKYGCTHWMKLVLAFFFCIVPVSVSAHVPYVPARDSSPQRPYEIPRWSALMGKSISVQDTKSPRGNAAIDVDTVKLTLTEADFDPALTLNGFIFEEEEEGHDTEPPLSEPIPLVITENGITGRKLHVKTHVAGCQSYAAVLPTIAVVGPVQEALPAATGAMELPFTLEEGQGVTILENTEQGAIWYDRFTYKSYYGQKSLNLMLTKPGDYYVHVWVPNGAAGEIVVELGHIESYGPREIMRSLAYNFWQIYDRDISSATCREELEALDGPNPSVAYVLKQLRNEFAPK